MPSQLHLRYAPQGLTVTHSPRCNHISSSYISVLCVGRSAGLLRRQLEVSRVKFGDALYAMLQIRVVPHEMGACYLTAIRHRYIIDIMEEVQPLLPLHIQLVDDSCWPHLSHYYSLVDPKSMPYSLFAQAHHPCVYCETRRDISECCRHVSMRRFSNLISNLRCHVACITIDCSHDSNAAEAIAHSNIGVDFSAPASLVHVACHSSMSLLAVTTSGMDKGYSHRHLSYTQVLLHWH